MEMLIAMIVGLVLAILDQLSEAGESITCETAEEAETVVEEII